MSDDRKRTIPELLADKKLIESAIQRGAREAVIIHAKLGRAVPTLRDGKVVWISPPEILAEFSPETNGHPAPPNGQ